MASPAVLDQRGSAPPPSCAAPTVTDSVELRWFGRGPVPPEVRTWFGDGAVEHRCDTYRLDRRSDVGLKLRSGHLLELKVRQSIGDQVELGDGLAGRLEHWRRWSPAAGMVEPEPDDRWGAVAKVITRRRFLDHGVEAVIDPAHVPDEYCDVELTEIAVNGTSWWSLALATYGPSSAPERLLRATWEAIAGTSPPAELTALGAQLGYPGWLARCDPDGAPVAADLGFRAPPPHIQ